MSQVWLISGSPGCGKTNWILNTFKNHSGNCGYIRLGGYYLSSCYLLTRDLFIKYQ